MEIKVLGPGCAKCTKTEKLVREVIQETGCGCNCGKSNRHAADRVIRECSVRLR